MSTPSEIQDLLNEVKVQAEDLFNAILNVCRRIEEISQTSGVISHIPRGTNQSVFNCVAPHIPKIAPGIAAEMGRNRTREYSGGPVEAWGLSTADYDDAIARLRAAGLLD